MAMEVEEEIGRELMAEFDYDLDDSGATFDIEEFKAMGVNPTKSTKAKPGTSEDWQLIVRKGNDGKDGHRGNEGGPSGVVSLK